MAVIDGDGLDWKRFQLIYESLGIGQSIPEDYIYDQSTEEVLPALAESFLLHGDSFREAYFDSLQKYYRKLLNIKNISFMTILNKKFQYNYEFVMKVMVLLLCVGFLIFGFSLLNIGMVIFLGAVVIYLVPNILWHRKDMKVLKVQSSAYQEITIKNCTKLEDKGSGEAIFSLLRPLMQGMGLGEANIEFYFSPQDGIQAEVSALEVEGKTTGYVKISRNLFMMARTNPELFVSVMAHELCHFVQEDTKVSRNYQYYEAMYSDRDKETLAKYFTVCEAWADLGSVVYSRNFRIFEIFENPAALLGLQIKLDGIHPSNQTRSKALKAVLNWNLNETMKKYQ